MLREIDQFFLEKEEPNKSCFMALRDIILAYDNNISEAWKYKLPFFLYQGKMFCYLWLDKKTKEPYIGIVKGKWIEHPQLVQGNRSQIKILPIDPNKDIPLKTMDGIFKMAMTFY